MQLQHLLDGLDQAGIHLGLEAGRLKVTGQRSVVSTFTREIRLHRDLLVAHVRGRRTGHVLAFCEGCGAATVTAAKSPAGKPRDNWPPCRETPSCGGRTQHGAAVNRHRPRQVDVDACRDAPAPPAQAQPPKATSKAWFTTPRSAA